MSTTPFHAPPPTQANIILTEKQERVRMFLWACLKTPPRFDVTIRPGAIRAAATFDKTAVGVKFEEIESSHDRIRVPVEFDLTTLEIDFERLAASTGLESARKVEETWESIKDLVDLSLPAAAVSEPAATQSMSENEPDLYGEDSDFSEDFAEWGRSRTPPTTLLNCLGMTAYRIQRDAFSARMRKCQKQLGLAMWHAVQTGVPSGTREEEWVSKPNDQLTRAEDDLQRVSSSANNRESQSLIPWYIQDLLGDRGLKNLEAHKQRCAKQTFSGESKAHSDYESASTLMESLLDILQRLRDSAGACGEAYQDRLQLVLKVWWCKTDHVAKGVYEGERRALAECRNFFEVIVIFHLLQYSAYRGDPGRNSPSLTKKDEGRRQ